MIIIQQCQYWKLYDPFVDVRSALYNSIVTDLGFFFFLPEGKD